MKDRRRLPDTRKAVTHTFTLQDLKFYLTVGLYDDGQPGEIFLRVKPMTADAKLDDDLPIEVGASHGGFVAGILNAFSLVFSTGLQFGTPLEALCRGISHMQFEPSGGLRHDEQLGNVKSVADYVGRYLMANWGKTDGK